MGFFRTRKNTFIQEGVNMEYQGILITGTSGAGKSIVAQKFCEKYEVFQLVKAITIREKRQNDIPGQYQYITEEEFEKLDKEEKLLIRTKYRDKYYGITHGALKQVIDRDKHPLLILTPKVVSELEREENEKRSTFFTIFLDAPDEILDNRLKQREGKINENITRQREEDRKYAKMCRYVINNVDEADPNDIINLIHSLWRYREVGGVLPKRIIELMIRCGMLLEDADLDNIQGASYDLILGDEHYHQGEVKTMDAKNAFIVMDPGDYVLTSSKEIANLPKDIVGRFDLSVGLFCQGVILSNGPQIDPGFRGRLFCLLFNTSNGKVQLKREQHFITIEFVKLIEDTTPYAGKYQNKTKITDYLSKMVEVSAIKKLIEDVKNLKKEKWYIKILPLVASILALILAIVLKG